ncbi:MAG: hydroxymethylbilane synthase [bacterium]
MKKIILGTRGSELALVQTHETAARLRHAHPGLQIEERIIKTTGDNRLDVSLSAPGSLDKGLFTKELEEALLRGEIHAAVHSLKDLPTELPPRLAIGAILEREDDSDCLASKHEAGWRGLPHGAIVATSSLRRKNQLLLLRPDLQTAEIRGNMGTRLRKLLESDSFDALILARAAINRLGPGLIPEGIQVTIIEEMLPAPGQGAIGIECLEDDAETLRILQAIHHDDTARCVTAERDFLKNLGGGCSLPLGARATIQNGQITLRAALFQNGKVEWLAR